MQKWRKGHVFPEDCFYFLIMTKIDSEMEEEVDSWMMETVAEVGRGAERSTNKKLLEDVLSK